EQRQQRVALVQKARQVPRQSSGAAVMSVKDPRGAGQSDLVAGEPQAPAQVDVLVVGEVRGIESAEVEIDGARDQHRSAAGEEQVAHPADHLLVNRAAKVLLPGEAVKVDASFDEVDLRSVPVEDHAPDADVAAVGVICIGESS